MYKSNINDSLIKNLGEELTRFIKENYFMANVLVVCEISFIVNSAFSSTLGFFVAKKNLIGLIKFIKKKLDKKKDEGEEGTKHEDSDNKGMVLSKNEKEKEYVDNKGEFIITLILYVGIITVAMTTDK